MFNSKLLVYQRVAISYIPLGSLRLPLKTETAGDHRTKAQGGGWWDSPGTHNGLVMPKMVI